jgi:3-hydroxyisobutyrate dehydrogenase-like beta-hydroxyacid dehydrogenase
MIKDLVLDTAAAEAPGAPSELGYQARAMYDAVAGAGDAAKDFSFLLEVLRARKGA